MSEERKPHGWNKFDALTRKLVQVPKVEADAQQDASRKERKAKRRKKK